MRFRRVVAQAPCRRANQECSITFTCAIGPPSSRSSAPPMASGTGISRPARMRSSGLRVHPPHGRAEAQAAWLTGADILRQQRDLLVLEKALHQGDHTVIDRACL